MIACKRNVYCLSTKFSCQLIFVASFMEISLAAEKLLTAPVTNSLLTGIIGSVIIIVLFRLLSARAKLKPSAKQNVSEIIIDSFLSLVESITQNRQKALEFLPLVLTFFIFILINNWLGLVPGVGSIGFHELKEGKEIFVPIFRSANADLNTTIALALIAVASIQYFGLKHLRLGYIKKFFDFSGFIPFFVGFLELISEFAKIISFSFRLFGNVFAGEVLLAVITSLVPIIAPVPFYGLEIFVGLIQALVFTMLSIVFMQVATQRH